MAELRPAHRLRLGPSNCPEPASGVTGASEQGVYGPVHSDLMPMTTLWLSFSGVRAIVLLLH
jgi:hypothetical protein